MLMTSWALLLISLSSQAAALTTDGLSLLALKAAITLDPHRILDSWVDSDDDPCAWRGVSCQSGRITAVSMANSSLEGYLPSELSLLSSLETLALPHNRFFGQIPSAIGNIRSLVSLDLSNNDFSGPVPSEIAGLESLVSLDLSSNQLNGSLPPAIAALPRLSGVLNLSCNLFTGKIPAAYGNFPVAVSLDLRQNHLSGEIPQVGSLLNQGPTAFAGNPALCGFPLKYACSQPVANANPSLNVSSPTLRSTAEERQRRPAAMIPILAVIIIVALVSVLVLQWQFRRRRATAAGGKGMLCKKGKGSPSLNDRREGQNPDEIYVAVDESFDLELEELLRASAYVIGKSRSGIVYKVLVSRGPALAVRRLSEIDDGNDPDDPFRRRRTFESEAGALGRARHPNLVHLRAYYYAPDEKLLIYDYIPNGNLFIALHGGQKAAVVGPAPMMLPWAARLAILKGVARGLAYLHECSARKLVHGSLKSSKILLDGNLRPYVSGFGISQLQRSGGGGSNQQPVAAEAGYAAPEMRSPPTQRGDVYAFGVMMMELATGRRPEAGMVESVRLSFKEARPLSELVDPTLLKEVHAKREVLAVFHIALGCTEAEPEARPRMRTVVEGLERIGPEV
ncbi:receptor protein kinase-like protein ZAR1 [Phalaenopsis equestris]|uniref:receptor protein kinase-like protein ZAR1 n=1 Tax=Phalaenopsis equestris TaxID=78828 RepID=UPI0009E24B94|nr:receptor protein kinase-like protein ZAR1 [Phalaenopsis equestris]